MIMEVTGLHSGMTCPRTTCDGVLKVANTIKNEETQRRIRYFVCDTCRCRPDGQQVLPLKYAPGRRRKT
jgi:hypothetical protein